MNDYARFKVFSILYGAAYMASFSTASLPVRVVPVLPGARPFSLEPLPLAEAGLPINWYSWLLMGFLVSRGRRVARAAPPRRTVAPQLGLGRQAGGARRHHGV